MMSLSDVAKITHLGWDTVKNIVKSDLLKRYSNVPLKDVTRIAIDENYLGKKAKFVTLVIDLDSGHVLWIGEGRGKAALEGFWPKLQGSKAKISAVACDMSAAYWAAVMEHLPEAAIVFDHFHIIKLANEAIDEVRRGLQRTLDLIGCKAIKGTRYLLLRGKENLTPEQQPTLEEALKWNEPLSQAYYLKEELRELWQQPDHASAASALQAWICKAMSTELGPMKRLAKTLLSHAKGVLNYFIHPISSGMMEGINNKIGRLTRLAYGYRDTLFLHLRILSLHETKTKTSGI
jgi:transposase